ncbi:MAG: hypothetical protein KGO94_06105 [Alphaproteobacteria bacterium]|nr:hypothetical protein [Alphaproteobacteria bacterium]
MSRYWSRDNNVQIPAPKLSSWLVTLLIFSVLGVFVDDFVSNIIVFWNSCTVAFPGTALSNLITLIFNNAIHSAVLDFPRFFVWPSYHLAGVAAVISALKFGRPSILFIVLTYVIATVAFFVMASGVGVLISMKVFFLPSSPFASIIVVPLCWAISRFFWR